MKQKGNSNMPQNNLRIQCTLFAVAALSTITLALDPAAMDIQEAANSIKGQVDTLVDIIIGLSIAFLGLSFWVARSVFHQWWKWIALGSVFMKLMGTVTTHLFGQDLNAFFPTAS